MADTRLIERWMPISALGEESIRERRSMTALPPTYYLHVWWARRPLIASRAAVLASILPADIEKEKFLLALGILKDPVEAKKRIEKATRDGVRLGADAYGYSRAFTYSPSATEKDWIKKNIARTGLGTPIILDPTAGGGSIPFESVRLGLNTLGNDLNPVAAWIEKATIEFPAKYGLGVLNELLRIGVDFTRKVRERLSFAFPEEADTNSRPDGYLWARTIICPYCEGVIPLSPNWRLAPDGTGVRLLPDSQTHRCSFEIVSSLKEQSTGTVSGGDATCPYPRCGRVIDGDEVKRQAQSGKMGDQLYCVIVKRKVIAKTKSGKPREKWERYYRAPFSKDDVSNEMVERLAGKMPEWEAVDIVPTESIPVGLKTDEPKRYGMEFWRDLFSSRQLYCHGISVEVFRELLEVERTMGLSPVTEAAFGYLALSMDKMLNYNSRMSVWMSTREVIANTFNRHDFAFCWSYAEMAPLITGNGYDWIIEQTGKCIKELVGLVHPDNGGAAGTPLFSAARPSIPPITLSCKPGEALDHIADASIDVVVMDPPYYDNVMYAELSDFFYVWLKRTAGLVYPELFRRKLTDKENEAVANPARFKGQKGAKVLAGREYQERMAAIFAECRRVLKSNGIMTLMFTHKATGAWDALTKGLMKAGFVITASWPINTESEGSLHIKDKAAANSTIFLVCRPRPTASDGGSEVYWEDVEPAVAAAVRKRVVEFQDAGISGVDLYLASFGPALEEFSKHWPLKRGTPRPEPEERRRRVQTILFEEPFDPYAVTPEDALDAARKEVKRWRLDQLSHRKVRAELDPLTSFFVLAWDAFKAPLFDYDEALRLARAVGVDLDRDIVGRLAEKKGSDIRLWDSSQRAAKGSLGPADGSRGMIDAIHHAAHASRTRTLAAARELLERARIDKDARFHAALQAVLEVLPVSKSFSGIELAGDVLEQSNDFEALENLRRLAFREQVEQPMQLEFKY